MLPSLLQQEAYMTKIDLKDAYLTVPVAIDSQPFLAFQGQEGVLFQFKVLPFGLYTAPYTFTKLTKPLVQFLRKVGTQILIYLDDMLLSVQSKQQLLVHSHLAVRITGIRNQCAEISPDSIEINRLLGAHNHYQHNDHITTSSEESGDTEGDFVATQMPLHTDMGTCMSVGEAYGNEASGIHRSSALLHPAEFALHAQQETVALSPEATDNLKWWSSQLHLHCSSPILKPEASMVITLDASLKS